MVFTCTYNLTPDMSDTLSLSCTAPTQRSEPLRPHALSTHTHARHARCSKTHDSHHRIHTRVGLYTQQEHHSANVPTFLRRAALYVRAGAPTTSAAAFERHTQFGGRTKTSRTRAAHEASTAMPEVAATGDVVVGEQDDDRETATTRMCTELRLSLSRSAAHACFSSWTHLSRGSATSNQDLTPGRGERRSRRRGRPRSRSQRSKNRTSPCQPASAPHLQQQRRASPPSFLPPWEWAWVTPRRQTSTRRQRQSPSHPEHRGVSVARCCVAICARAMERRRAFVEGYRLRGALSLKKVSGFFVSVTERATTTTILYRVLLCF